MYERSHGYRYAELGEYPSAAQVAKAIRADIAQAITEGMLPGKPVSYSVRSDTFSGGCSVDVTVRDWPDAIWTEHPTQVDNWGAPRRVLTPDADAARMTLERIHGAYNHDGSETQVDYFDVRYYGQVSFESPSSAAGRKAEAAKKAQRKAARTTAEAAGKRRIVNWSGGKHTVHDAVEVEGRLKLVCGAQLWRGALIGPADGQQLTCSRCAKKAG